MAASFDPLLDLPGTDALTRRRFLCGATIAAAALPLITESKLAWASQPKPAEIAARVLLNANENPLGPCPAALEAIAGLGARSGRYDFDASAQLGKLIMEQEGLREGYIALYPGASQPLQYAVLAFATAAHGLVCADPGYEAPGMAASRTNASVHYVPLRNDYSHDVKAMVAANPAAGCFYICNPNNPTGTLTSREDILWLLDHKPRGAVVIVDEAYIHYADGHTVLDLALADRDVVVLRTFSEIYGLAGLRCGYAVARPTLLAKMQIFGLSPLSLPGVVAAQASMLEKDLVSTRKKANAELRDATIDWLKKQGYAVIPSQANFFMVDVKRPGVEFVKAMAKRNVYVGRTWPIWPSHVRVTVGTVEEMGLFQEAFTHVTTKTPEDHT